MDTTLFDAFDPVSSKQWKQKIQFELDGADYNETLIWNSPEDIKVKPFYHHDEFSKSYPVATQATQWKICQAIFVHDVNKSAERALDCLRRGAESLLFTVKDSSLDLALLLTPLPLKEIKIYFEFSFLDVDSIRKIEKIAIEKNATLFYNLDPLGYFAREGNWFTSKEKDNFDSLNRLSKLVQNQSFISVDGALYQNAGANMVQQIAYALAHANEYLNRIPNYNQNMVFKIAVGSNYFFEIAKLRALRLLFDLIVKEYNPNIKCHFLVTPSKRNKTVYAYNTNMIRTTTECMSAILGGADAIMNLPYDALYHKDNEFGNRIARNQLLLLKHESYFDKVNNPAEGSYYIESLTSQLAEKSLTLFKEIENKGGFLKQLNEGHVKRKIQESADKEQALFDSGKEVLIGTNKFPNKEDQMSANIELYPFVKIKPRKTLITPIIEKRLSEKIEQERLNLEKKENS